MGRKIKERMAALLLAGGLTFGSVFGLSGCKNKNVEVENNDEMAKLEQVIEDQQSQINALQKEVEENRKNQSEIEQTLLKQELLTLFDNTISLVSYYPGYFKCDEMVQDEGDDCFYKTLRIYNSKSKTQCFQAWDDKGYTALFAETSDGFQWYAIEDEDVDESMLQGLPNMIQECFAGAKQDCLYNSGKMEIKKIDENTYSIIHYEDSSNDEVEADYVITCKDGYIAKVERRFYAQRVQHSQQTFELIEEDVCNNLRDSIISNIETLQNTTDINP